jgi:hypothetical protein
VLSGLQQRVERRMVDQCTITRDSEGTQDDVLDQSTGQLVRPVGEPTTVYSGKCLIYPKAFRVGEVEEGDVDVTTKPYAGAVPIGAPLPNYGDTFTVTASRDPQMFGRVFRVINVLSDTFAVTHELELQDRASL